ncbi:MAG: WXG100 family type VII secretion target [Coriobacteriia bacterium]|nr:WXG100 family type VII secretion target [Coriobacteriia bacterium]
MLFNISINELEKTIADYDRYLAQINSLVDECEASVLSLAKNGWQGVSGAVFYEKFFIWMKVAKNQIERITYFRFVLAFMYELAKELQTQYSSLPQAVNVSTFNSDIVHYSETSLWQTRISKDHWEEVWRDICLLGYTISGLRHVRLDYSRLFDIALSAQASKIQLQDFETMFDKFVKSVSLVDRDIIPRLEYTLNDSFDYVEPKSLIGSLDVAGYFATLSDDVLHPRFLPKVKQLPGITTNLFHKLVGKVFPKYRNSYTGPILEPSSAEGSVTTPPVSPTLKYFQAGIKSMSWVLVGLSAADAANAELNRNPYLPLAYAEANSSWAGFNDLVVSIGTGAIGSSVTTLAIATFTVSFTPIAIAAASGLAISAMLSYDAKKGFREAQEADNQRWFDELFKDSGI